MSEAGRLFTKKCRSCNHPLSLHGVTAGRPQPTVAFQDTSPQPVLMEATDSGRSPVAETPVLLQARCGKSIVNVHAEGVRLSSDSGRTWRDMPRASIGAVAWSVAPSGSGQLQFVPAGRPIPEEGKTMLRYVTTTVSFTRESQEAFAHLRDTLRDGWPSPEATPPLADEATAPTQAQAPVSIADPLAALERLGELHRAGVLSDDDFANKKAQLLDRI